MHRYYTTNCSLCVVFSQLFGNFPSELVHSGGLVGERVVRTKVADFFPSRNWILLQQQHYLLLLPPPSRGNKIVLMADYGVGDYANSTWLLAVSAAHCVCHCGWQLSMKFSTPSKVNEITLGRLLYVFDTNP